MKISIPDDCKNIINILRDSGYETYVVGGCVRDSILGRDPHDWDLCTSARPENIMRIFANTDFSIIKTGIKHGTVTLFKSQDQKYEITTFRIDGTYSDGRHPDSIRFADSIEDDLSRRDFTINAMAYNDLRGLVDPFKGRSDLSNRIIRCVGNPEERFLEDALRMMRAIRFSSQLSFEIDRPTFDAIIKNHDLIRNVSYERIADELSKILVSQYPNINDLHECGLLKEIIPELEDCVGVKQNNPYHCFDVFSHTVISVSCIEPDLVLRITMLLHDIGKPLCKTTDEDHIDHFKGHGKISAEIARKILVRLRYSNEIMIAVRDLVSLHDIYINDPSKKSIRRFLSHSSEKEVRNLFKIRRADIKAQNPGLISNRIAKVDYTEDILNEVIRENHCFSKKDLAINGNDLIKLGLKEGEQIGKILDTLLNNVIEDPFLNTREELLKEVLDIIMIKGEN